MGGQMPCPTVQSETWPLLMLLVLPVRLNATSFFALELLFDDGDRKVPAELSSMLDRPVSSFEGEQTSVDSLHTSPSAPQPIVRPAA
jgi:hypothetical protein